MYVSSERGVLGARDISTFKGHTVDVRGRGQSSRLQTWGLEVALHLPEESWGGAPPLSIRPAV